MERCKTLVTFVRAVLGLQLLHVSAIIRPQRVPYKPDREYPMTMYLTHRVFYESVLRVRKARAKHLSSLEVLLEGVEDAESLLWEYRRILEVDPEERDEEQAYIFTCDDDVVGAAIVWYLFHFSNLIRHFVRLRVTWDF